jgi:hypothetical protein
MQMQEILHDTNKEFEFIITDAMLKYFPCPPHVMLSQFDRLMVMAGLANVTLGIMPSASGLAAAQKDDFLVADDTAIAQMFPSVAMQVSESDAYVRIFDGLMAEAVTGDAAISLIDQAAAALRTTAHRDASYAIVEEGWEHDVAGVPSRVL